MTWFGIFGWILAILFVLCLGYIVGVHAGIDMEQRFGGDDDDV